MTRWLLALGVVALMLCSAAIVAWLRPDPMLATVMIRGDSGHGTGFAVSPYEVVTNAHVVDTPETLRVITILGGVAVIKGIYIYPNADLAVLTVAPKLPHYLAVACEWPRRGERVTALGHPLMTAWGAFGGRIASDLPIGDKRVVSLDIGLNHGMSGGPIVNWWGEVVAVTSAFIAVPTGGHATGIAVPGDVVCDAIERARALDAKL